MEQKKSRVVSQVSNHRYLNSLQSESQRSEDEFMELHGGVSSRVIYSTVLAFTFVFIVLCRLIKGVFYLFKREKK